MRTAQNRHSCPSVPHFTHLRFGILRMISLNRRSRAEVLSTEVPDLEPKVIEDTKRKTAIHSVKPGVGQSLKERKIADQKIHCIFHCFSWTGLVFTILLPSLLSAGIAAMQPHAYLGWLHTVVP